MDKGEPAMGSSHAGHKGVGVGVLKGLADAGEPKGGDEEAKGGSPGAESVGGDLTDGAEGEHGAQIEILAEVGVCEGRGEPADEVGAISGMKFSRICCIETVRYWLWVVAVETYTLDTMALLTLYSRITYGSKAPILPSLMPATKKQKPALKNLK